jgi:CBS domain-containing protein
LAQRASRVRELMTKDPVAIPLETRLPEAARIMRDNGIGNVLVMSNGHLCGVLTDRDIVVRAVAEQRNLSRTTAGDVCSAEIVTVAPDDDAGAAIDLMRTRAVRRIPVVDEGKPVGIVSMGDLAIDHDPGSVLSEISKAPANT